MNHRFEFELNSKFEFSSNQQLELREQRVIIMIERCSKRRLIRVIVKLCGLNVRI